MSMLDYAKLILSKVCFDKQLFLKEYRKFIRMLPAQEVSELVQWRRTNFSEALG
jgi:hypothetical protein